MIFFSPLKSVIAGFNCIYIPIIWLISVLQSKRNWFYQNIQISQNRWNNGRLKLLTGCRYFPCGHVPYPLARLGIFTSYPANQILKSHSIFQLLEKCGISVIDLTLLNFEMKKVVKNVPSILMFFERVTKKPGKPLGSHFFVPLSRCVHASL